LRVWKNVTGVALRAEGIPFGSRARPAGIGASGVGGSCGLFLLALLILSFLGTGHAEAGPSPIKPRSYGYFDFPTCVRYSLVHSEQLLQNRLEIQVKSADVKDAHAEVLPSLDVITRYYIAEAGGGKPGQVNVNLFMKDFNPYLALLKVKANSILVDIAKLSHYKKIADGTSEMAKLFCGIQFLDKSIGTYKQIAALHQNKVTYGRSLDQQGNADPLELRLWANAAKSSRVEITSLENERKEKITQLKMLMGYQPDYELPLDIRDAVKQVLDGFNGRAVTFADVQGFNLALKIMAKKEQVQSSIITGTYVALLPRPNLVFEQIQNQVDRTSGFNFALGLDYTIWDGFKRVRDIKRQKLKAEQLKLDRSLLSQKLYGEFKHLRGELGLASEKESVAREEAKLAEMAEERAFVQYKAGEITYDSYLDKSIQKGKANLNVLKTVQSRVQALIELATLAGGMDRYNAGIRY
jgi:outer membrane protein TolC